MNQNILNRIQELWAKAQKREITWQEVYKRLSIYFETMVVMREYEAIQDLIFLMEITLKYQVIRWEQRRKFSVVR